MILGWPDVSVAQGSLCSPNMISSTALFHSHKYPIPCMYLHQHWFDLFDYKKLSHWMTIQILLDLWYKNTCNTN
jgi:hypothetical protein